MTETHLRSKLNLPADPDGRELCSKSHGRIIVVHKESFFGKYTYYGRLSPMIFALATRGAGEEEEESSPLI